MKSLRSRLYIGSVLMALAALQSGTALAAFEGFGSDIPLELAAKQIVPDSYSIDYGSGVDTSTEISWGSSSDWKKALSSAVAKKGLKAEFGSDTVVIVKSSEPSSTKSSSRPYSSTPAKEMVQKKRSSSPRVKPKSPPRVSTPEVGGGGFVIRPYQKATSSSGMSGKDLVGKGGWKDYQGRGQFIVENGYMLHGTLNTWAEATGWKVVWESDHDYFIEATASFSGDFVEASSALVKAMGDARPQITVDYYNGNKVMVVSNKLSDSVNR